MLLRRNKRWIKTVIDIFMCFLDVYRLFVLVSGAMCELCPLMMFVVRCCSSVCTCYTRFSPVYIGQLYSIVNECKQLLNKKTTINSNSISRLTYSAVFTWVLLSKLDKGVNKYVSN